MFGKTPLYSNRVIVNLFKVNLSLMEISDGQKLLLKNLTVIGA